MSEKNADQAELHRQGKPLPDPKTNVRPIALQVPRVQTVLDLMRSSYERLQQTTDRDRACTTGHYELDHITGGFRPGFTWLFGATTSWGKSSWLVSVADINICLGKRVLICSSEDTEEVYGDRLMVRRAQVDALRYRNKRLEMFEQKAVEKAVKEAQEIPVFCDARRYPVEDLAGYLVKMIREEKIDLVAFDYVQEFRSKRRFQDERVKFREIASVLRHVAKDAKVPGIIFSQLTTDENTKVPTRLNIRDCRDMANAAEVIVLGFEPSHDLKHGDVVTVHKGTKCLYVDKVKNGPRNRIVGMKWNHSGAYFEAVADPATEAQAAEQPPQEEFDYSKQYEDDADHYRGRG